MCQLKNEWDIKVVRLKRSGKSEHIEIGKWPLTFQGKKWKATFTVFDKVFFVWQEGTFAMDASRRGQK